MFDPDRRAVINEFTELRWIAIEGPASAAIYSERNLVYAFCESRECLAWPLSSVCSPLAVTREVSA